MLILAENRLSRLMDDQPTLHSIDKALAAHVAGCTEESRHMWHELRSLKKAVWTVVGMTIGTLSTLVLYFGAKALHL